MGAAKIEPRVSALKRRAAQHDRQIAAIRKLLAQGARMLIKLEEQTTKTSKTLDDFIRSLKGGGASGHGKTDVQ